MLKNLTQRLKHQAPLVIIILFITTILLLETSNIYHWSILDRAENFLYDLRIITTMPKDIDDRVIIVDIDEKSLNEIGRWPWSRNNVANLVDTLFDEYGITLLGFDIVFPEPDYSSGLNILKGLEANQLANNDEFKKTISELETQLNYDQLLADSIEKNQVVLGYFFKPPSAKDNAINNGVLPEPSIDNTLFENSSIEARRAKGYGANINIIRDAGLDAGHFSPWLDPDGVIRRVPMLYEFEGHYYEALSLVMVRHLLEIEKTKPVFEQSTNSYKELEILSLGFIDIPVDKHIQALVPYRGYQGSYPYISATDIIHGRIDKSILKDAIVLVGTTAPGLFDLRTTPVKEQYAGVEIHANLISGILDENIKKSPAYVQGIEFLQLLLIGLLLTLALPLLSPLWAALLSLILAIVITMLNLSLWQFANLALPLASSLLLIIFLFVSGMSYGFFIERRSKLQIASTFGQYIPPELIDEMNFNPDSYTLEAENREMTVLFSDIRGFTTISEGLTPAELSKLMNAYMTPMTKIIHEKRGTIDKYIGDAIMAFWGAPLDNPEHARYALEAALGMLERLNAIREEFVERGWPPVRIGIGLNTGIMSVGNMGSEFRLSYTVMGDPVNLGSRLEGLTKSYGVELIVSETTKAAVPEYAYRELDFVKVKGKDKPIGIFEPIALKEELSQEELDELSLWQQALHAYRQQQWDEAQQLLKETNQKNPDRKLYSIYLERIKIFIENPPRTDWDGVYVHTTK